MDVGTFTLARVRSLSVTFDLLGFSVARGFGPHRTCSGGPAYGADPASAQYLAPDLSDACRSGDWRDCNNDADRDACFTACAAVGTGGCCRYRAHLVSAAGDGRGRWPAAGSGARPS